MLAAYWLATGLIFIVFNDAAISINKFVDGFIVFGFFSLLSFWYYMLISSIAWIKLRSRPYIAVSFTLLVCMSWAIVTSALESYEVRPGLFGRAIDGGHPTIHYFVDTMVVAIVTIMLFELAKFTSKKTKG